MVDELKSDADPDYRANVLALINCLIARAPDSDERDLMMKEFFRKSCPSLLFLSAATYRSFSVVGFADVMPALWKQACSNDGLLIQIGVFDRLVEKDDAGFIEDDTPSSSCFCLLEGILSNVSNPTHTSGMGRGLPVVLFQVEEMPEMEKFVSILKHLAILGQKSAQT